MCSTKGVAPGWDPIHVNTAYCCMKSHTVFDTLTPIECTPTVFCTFCWFCRIALLLANLWLKRAFWSLSSCEKKKYFSLRCVFSHLVNNGRFSQFNTLQNQQNVYCRFLRVNHDTKDNSFSTLCARRVEYGTCDQFSNYIYLYFDIIYLRLGKKHEGALLYSIYSKDYPNINGIVNSLPNSVCGFLLFFPIFYI